MSRSLLFLLLIGCQESPPSVSAPERPSAPTRNPWKLTFTKVLLPAGSGNPKVLVTMERSNPPVQEKHWHEPGDRIGWWPERPGGEPVGVHPIPLFGGVTTPVDFETGFNLISVEPKTVVNESTRCKPVFARDGTQTGCEPFQERRSFSTQEVVIRSVLGEERILVPEPVLPSLCAFHAPNRPPVEYTEHQKARMRRWIGSAPYDDSRNYIRPLLEREGIPYEPWEKRTGLTMIGTDTPENARRARALVRADATERGYSFYAGFDAPSTDKK